MNLAGAGGPGFEVVTAARDAIVRHKMLSLGDTVVVAVSGGPDSTCLLDVLGRLSEGFELTLVVAHVDHGIGESSEDHAAEVSRRAAIAGYDVHVARASGLQGANLHARAREFRYAFFESLASQVGAAKVATGHTLDDRVETTLARLVHGGATDQLASIPAHEGLRIRPLIEVRRRETREYCESNGLDYVTDPANDDPRFERARVRASLKGAIEEGWGEGAIRAMASAADRFREDSVALGSLLDRVFGSLVDPAEDEVRIDRAAFEGLPKALQRRALERVVGPVRDRGKAIDAVLEALEGNPKPGSRFAVAAGSEIVIERDNLVVTTATGGLDGSL